MALQDDKEIEFLLTISNEESGTMQILKTRDSYTVETQLTFELMNLSSNELEIFQMEYNFDPELLLINSQSKHFKSVKNVFKSKLKLDTISMLFKRSELLLTGKLSQQICLQIQSQGFDNYLNHIDEEGN